MRIKIVYALSGSSRNVRKEWGAEHDAAWTQLKEAICRATCRHPANPLYQKVVVTDASKVGLGGFVAQIELGTGILHPLGFFARTLTGKEPDMSPRQLERRALIGTLHKYASILTGQRLAVRELTEGRWLSQGAQPTRLRARVY
eukprot:SAG31_NODE_22061_length_534_cov_3.827586_1_plen_144_part_00